MRDRRCPSAGHRRLRFRSARHAGRRHRRGRGRVPIGRDHAVRHAGPDGQLDAQFDAQVDAATTTDTPVASDVSVPDTTVADPSATEPTTTASTDSTLASGVTIEELADDMEAAQQVVDGFWAKHWSDFYTGTTQPPTVVGLYDGTDADDAPTCDGEPLEAYNAFYCVSEDYVAWDASLLVNGADLIGDSWVYLVIAHEWGHAIQARLEARPGRQAEELQADCLGAAALYGAVADSTLNLTPATSRS